MLLLQFCSSEVAQLQSADQLRTTDLFNCKWEPNLTTFLQLIAENSNTVLSV